MDNHRNSARLRSFLRGKVIFNHGNSSMDCVVRDISATGAKLEMGQTHALPDRFELHVPQKGTTYHVRVAWRTESEIGVAFPDTVAVEASADVGPAEGDVARRLTQLEAETRHLRELLSQMRRDLQEVVASKRAASN